MNSLSKHEHFLLLRSDARRRRVLILRLRTAAAQLRHTACCELRGLFFWHYFSTTWTFSFASGANQNNSHSTMATLSLCCSKNGTRSPACRTSQLQMHHHEFTQHTRHSSPPSSWSYFSVILHSLLTFFYLRSISTRNRSRNSTLQLLLGGLCTTSKFTLPQAFRNRPRNLETIPFRSTLRQLHCNPKC